MTDDKSIAIIGLGWLGLPLAEVLLARGYVVKGSTTTAEKAAQLIDQGIDAKVLRLDPAPTTNPAELLTADTVIINIPPKAGQQGDSFHPQQVGYLVDAIRRGAARHIIYISSTSVYPERSEPVAVSVEDDVHTPDQSAAPALVEAEQKVLTLAPERLVTILRCGGLMGYGRIPGKYVAGKTVDTGAVPVNYIHRDDVIGLLIAVMDKKLHGTFNAVAPEHPTREAIYRRSCTDFEYDLPTFVAPEKPLTYKVISPEKLILATDYSFQYPNPLEFPYSQS
ncbi:NAD(P)-binding domain-containing protein [Spirosoma rhododendri]|uniref:NAD(P)H-binding protein n=1 Tax=Spirosoma rhododendri TaxID=2728024 RepID=A0A7L5DLQ9_9BACT|nr:NAD(P)-binding domain-containing protein [Spirosoma rhododendri]QJD78133.1 NAD(P)H-binding protein [Spirosoma rhododendri]